jgi:hypothetical protein
MRVSMSLSRPFRYSTKVNFKFLKICQKLVPNPVSQATARKSLQLNALYCSLEERPSFEMTGPEAESRGGYVTIHTRRAEIRELFGRGTTGKSIPCLCGSSR